MNFHNGRFYHCLFLSLTLTSIIMSSVLENNANSSDYVMPYDALLIPSEIRITKLLWEEVYQLLRVSLAHVITLEDPSSKLPSIIVYHTICNTHIPRLSFKTTC